MSDIALGYWLNRAGFLMRGELVRRFRAAGFDLTAEEFAILNRAHLDNGPTQKEIAEKTTKDKTTMTRFIDRLVKKGLLVRRPDPTDRRRARVYLIKRGVQTREALLPIAFGLVQDSIRGIPAGDVQVAMDVLKRISDNLADM